MGIIDFLCGCCLFIFFVCFFVKTFIGISNVYLLVVFTFFLFLKEVLRLFGTTFTPIEGKKVAEKG